MPQYKFEGFDETGGRLGSIIDADSESAALAELQRRGVMVSRLAPVGSERDWRAIIGMHDSAVGLGELEFLTAELSLLLESGVRIDRAVGILQRASKGGAMARLLNSLMRELKQGRQLSEALAKHPEVFSSLYINLVALGEAGGRLPTVFRGLADDLRFQRDLRQKVISASTYPMVVASVCIIAVLFIFNFVVPNLQTLFVDAEELPWYTTLLLDSSTFMREWQWVVFGGLAAVAIGIWRSRSAPAVIDFKDKMLLNLPGLRDGTSMVERIRFSSGLALMLDAGLPVDRALTLACGNIRHGALRREVLLAVDKVKRGEQISRSMRQTQLFPDYFASLLEVGEESGELARVFAEIARRTRDAFSRWTLRLTTLLEPMLILIMGLIVGGVVVVMMLSITSVTEVGL